MSKKKLKPTDIPKALAHIEGMNVKAVLRRRGIYLKLRQNIEFKEAALPMAAALLKKRNGKSKQVIDIKSPQKYMSFTDEVVETYKVKQIHNVETLEKYLHHAINKFLLNTVLPRALDNVQAAVDTHKSMAKTKKMVFDADDKAYLINQAKMELEPYLQNMAVIAGQEANGLLGDVDPYVPSDALRKRVQGNVEKFTTSMIDTDQDHLSGIIINGIDEGLGVPEISSTIKGEFVDYSANQATLITRTEVLRSANQSAVDAFKQSGVVEGKQWVIAGADDECADYDGEVVMLDGNFYSSEGEFQDGDPPLHPNCKCVVIPVLSSDENDNQEASFTDAQRKAMHQKIKKLEALTDKRTKEFRKFKQEMIEKQADNKAYIKALEKYLGVDSEQA